jgi:hypothetical protein
MAISAVKGLAPYDARYSVTVSLGTGWKDGDQSPGAGDIVGIAFIGPKRGVLGPPGWNRAGDGVFWKAIGPCEPDPVFSVPGGEGDWETAKCVARPVGEHPVLPTP